MTWTTDDTLRITYCRLTEAEIRSAKVLGGPREVGGIVQIEVGDERIWGHLLGQVCNRGGLQLSPIAYPSYPDALRAEVANSYGVEATAARIDRDLAYRVEMLDAEVRS